MAVALALLSSLLWGTADFLGGTVSRRIPAVVAVGWSQAVGLVLAVVIVVTLPGGDQWREVLPEATGAAVTGVAGLVLFYAALARGTMGVVAPITALGGAVPLAAGLARGEEPASIQLVGLVLALLGVVLASGPELSGRAGSLPIVLAAGAAVAFGVTLLLIAEGAEIDAVGTVLGMRLVTTIAGAVALVVVLVLRRARVASVPRTSIGAIAVIGAFDLSANVVYGIASTMSLLSLVAVAGSLYPVVTVVLARVVHGERLARIQQAGVAGALVGVALIASG